MHPMVKFLINSITDGKPIDWDMVDRELERITISEREKRLCKELKTIYKVQEVAKTNYETNYYYPCDRYTEHVIGKDGKCFMCHKTEKEIADESARFNQKTGEDG